MPKLAAEPGFTIEIDPKGFCLDYVALKLH